MQEYGKLVAEHISDLEGKKLQQEEIKDQGWEELKELL